MILLIPWLVFDSLWPAQRCNRFVHWLLDTSQDQPLPNEGGLLPVWRLLSRSGWCSARSPRRWGFCCRSTALDKSRPCLGCSRRKCWDAEVWKFSKRQIWNFYLFYLTILLEFEHLVFLNILINSETAFTSCKHWIEI